MHVDLLVGRSGLSARFTGRPFSSTTSAAHLPQVRAGFLQGSPLSGTFVIVLDASPT